MSNKNYTITASNFASWYFDYGQDTENEFIREELANKVINDLEGSGRSIVTAKELFDQCNKGAIRIYFLEEFESIMNHEDDEREIQELGNDFTITFLEVSDEVEEAKKVLRDAGYFVDNLWTVRDVIDGYTEQDGSQVSEETAYEILKEVLENPFMIENINEQISFTACDYSTFNLIKTR